MFEPVHELASDLEWMLGSDQVSKEMLLDALVDEYFESLFQLSMLVLNDSDAAACASRDTLALALINKYHYRETMGVKQWIYQFELQALQKYDKNRQSSETRLNSVQRDVNIGSSTPYAALDTGILVAFDKLVLRERTLLVLYFLQNWSAGELALLLDLSAEEIEQKLLDIQNTLYKAIQPGQLDTNQVNQESLRKIIQSSLGQRWGQAALYDYANAETFNQINRTSKRLGLRQKGFSYFKELLLVLLIILAVTGFIWGGNTFFPDDQATETPISTVLVTKIIIAEVTPNQEISSIEPQVTRTPSELGPTPVPVDVLYEVDYGDQIEEIAKLLGVSPATLQNLNRIPAGEELKPGTQLLIPGSLPKTRRYATTVPTTIPRSPISTPISEADILRRLSGNNSSFNSLWVEAYIADYGPLGYVGPSKILKTQAWLSDHQSLILVGSPEKGVEEVLLRNGIYWYLAQPGKGQPWFNSQDGDGPINMQFYPELNLLINSILGGRREIGPELSIIPIERVDWAGQSTLLVEGRDEADRRLVNFWLEDARQIILRKQWYSESDPEILSQEIAITKIQYDIDFPQELFDSSFPWRGEFAEDYRGSPVPESDWALPTFIAQASRQIDSLESEPFNLAALEFAKAQLTFAFQNNFNVRNPNAPADLYLDRRFIGTALFGNPWTSVCQRSPDGRKLAFVSQPLRFNSLNSQLRWLNLDGPFGLGRALDDMIVTNFAWAPDSRHLAVFGYDPLGPAQIGHLINLDSQTGESETLVKVDAANSLVWRPDGKRLAMIVRPYPDSFEEQIFVIDTDDGGIVNRIPIDVDNGYSDDWPMEEWGVDFPVLMGNIEACASPVQ